MYRKLSVGLLATTFFAVLVSSGVAIASQSVPQDRLSLVLGESCRAEGQACRNDGQCCSGTCQSRSILPWIPGKCIGSSPSKYLPPQPTDSPEPTRTPQPTYVPKPTKGSGDDSHQRQCRNMNQEVERLEKQLSNTEQEMIKLKKHIQAVKTQTNEMCSQEQPPREKPTITPTAPPPIKAD
jgi:hypothetical protein